jgi:purine nucleosidase
MAARKIILDLDNGLTLPVADTDDAMTLALALASPEVDLLGCTCCPGNCRAWQSAENSLRLLELAGRPDIPVALGRETPLVRDRTPHFAYLDQKAAGPGARFWADLPLPPTPRTPPSKLLAHELMIELVRRQPGEITLVMAGALTNLAIALLAAPEIAPLIRGVVHMGGGFAPKKPGDAPLAWITPDIPDAVWRHVLRFNTLFDPEASAIVFNSEIPLTLVPVNVTAQVFQHLEAIKELESCGSAFHDHLLTYGRPWVAWSMAERRLPGAHMHDPLTLAVLIEPGLCRYRAMHLDVARLLAGEPGWLGEGPAGGRVQVAVAVAAQRFESLLARRLAAPPLASAAIPV